MKISIPSYYIKQYTEALQNKIIKAIKEEVERDNVNTNEVTVDILRFTEGVLYGDVFYNYDWIGEVYININDIVDEEIKWKVLEIEV